MGSWRGWARGRTCCGFPAKVRRSFSNISTPAKPDEAAASILSKSEPERQTVAIDRRCLLGPSVVFIDVSFPQDPQRRDQIGSPSSPRYAASTDGARRLSAQFERT